MNTEQTSSKPSENRRTADIAVICSRAAEVAGLLKRMDRVRRYEDGGIIFRGGFLRESLRIAVVETGPEFAACRRAMETLLKEHQPASLIGVSFARALAESVRPGDICLAKEVHDEHGNAVPLKMSSASSSRIHVGRILCADRLPSDSQQLNRLRSEYPESLCADTISLAVAQVGVPAGLPVLLVQGVVTAADEVPDAEQADVLFGRPTASGTGGITSVLSRLTKFRTASGLQPYAERVRKTAGNVDRCLSGLIEQLADRLAVS